MCPHDDLFDYDDLALPDPVVDGTRHGMGTDDEGRLDCCGEKAVLLPVGAIMTADPLRVTCTGPVAS